MARKDKYDECEYTGDRACAVEAFLDVLGGRWKGMILFHLLAAPPSQPTRRFGELRRLLPHVTQRMLTAQLREMERDGIVARKVYAQVPPKVEYSLTALGAKLDPIVRVMAEWGDEYMVAYEKARARDGAAGAATTAAAAGVRGAAVAPAVDSPKERAAPAHESRRGRGKAQSRGSATSTSGAGSSRAAPRRRTRAAG